MRAVKDCVAGSVGGILQVFAGQPFDTIKVRLQTQPTPAPGAAPLYTGTIDCVKKTLAKEGFSGFYKGTTTPLVGVGACVSIQFLVLEAAKRAYTNVNKKAGKGADSNILSFSQLYVAGAASGVANSVVSGPVEHIRTRLQVQTSSRPALTGGAGSQAPSKVFYTGPIDCIQKIYKSYGLRGIYKGQVATMIREFQGYGAYFLAYEYLVQRAMQKENKARDQLATWKVCIFGAAAGYAMWLTVYPIDIVKSKLQTDSFDSASQKYKSMIDCARKTFAHEGAAGFFRGIAPCIIRAAPANAATFVGFEFAMRFLQ
ncbi:mitochondrial carrier [Basidiobolus meristosporus CBS 931.73]|uniref:Mitochondrial carrier n=1 Tax=Basidiobolus meristosporus CBS 931.73 TaxID=1314790 RepID=A0A1Y1Y6E2_9FUNG|nr:mitochondrial carrier [Basidiobolus meristosporus CBS 931.73]|eukprot:ORX93539.1 mitochondrial carrier [Basidiobolus meristosporus CBS 931.73]